jgi:hypothetical protein
MTISRCCIFIKFSCKIKIIPEFPGEAQSFVPSYNIGTDGDLFVIVSLMYIRQEGCNRRQPDR